MNTIDSIRGLAGLIQFGNLHKKNNVEKMPINDLLTNPYNRELKREKVNKIKEDIKESGEVFPLVYTEIDHDGKPAKMVVDGHHRFQALKEMKYKTVPVIMQDNRGIETKAPKQRITKLNIYRRFNRHDKVLFFSNRVGAWDQGIVMEHRLADSYTIRDQDGVNQIVRAKQMRPMGNQNDNRNGTRQYYL